MNGHAWPTYTALARFNLWAQLFPDVLDDPRQPPVLVEQALKSTDQRVAEGKPVTPAFLFAAFLWQRVEQAADDLVADGVPPVAALAIAGEDAIVAQARRVALPRGFSSLAK